MTLVEDKWLLYDVVDVFCIVDDFGLVTFWQFSLNLSIKWRPEARFDFGGSELFLKPETRSSDDILFDARGPYCVVVVGSSLSIEKRFNNVKSDGEMWNIVLFDSNNKVEMMNALKTFKHFFQSCWTWCLWAWMNDAHFRKRCAFWWWWWWWRGWWK